LLPLLSEYGTEQQLLQRAAVLGLSVSADEIQAAADRFRRQNNLTSAQETDSWLKEERLNVADFEEEIKRNLVLSKLCYHVTSGDVARYFDQNQSLFDRVRVRHLLTATAGSSQSLLRDLVPAISEAVSEIVYPAPASSATPSSGTSTLFRFESPTEAFTTIFGAAPGSLVGPLSINDGFHFFLVEATEPASLDEDTVQAIRRRLFSAWVSANIAGDLPDRLLSRMV
jgi:parvulin-like peptidyl-prolyl isomerase